MTNPTPHGQVPAALRFTKRPVTIEAIRWTGKNLREVITFTDGPPDTRSHHAGMAWEAYADLVARDGLMIYTLEDGPDRRAKHFADIGDWIIRGVKGEYYPCKPDIFEATYDRAAHVQNPAEIEHVAGDVSKNGAESDMAQQPAPSAAALRVALEQAARQALETLERASDAGYSVECDETITALREALEQVAPRKTEQWNPMDSSNAETALQMAVVIAHRDTEAAHQQATPHADSQPAPVLDRARIREIFMAHGFTVKEGQTDLKQYVYDAADALLRAARAAADSVTAPAGGATGKNLLQVQAADSVLEDADRYRWLFGARTDAQAVSVSETVFKPLPQDEVLSHLQGFYMSKTVVDALVDAARKQGANHD